MKSLLLNLNWTPAPWTVRWTLPLYQAHRGYWVEGATENSKEAFYQAKERKYEMFEMDVRLSQDLVPVVYHDPHLARFGRRKEMVRDFTAHQLKELFDIPTLEEILKFEQRPEKMNIELKADQGFESLLEKKVCELIRHRTDPILISSFNPYSIWFCGELLPQIPRALLITQNAKEKGNTFILRHGLLAPLVKPHILHLDFRDISTSILSHYLKQEIPVSLWTVNDPELGEAYLKAGAFSLITDRLLP